MFYASKSYAITDLSQETLSFPNSIEEQEKLKEEDECSEVSSKIFLDSSSIRIGFSLLCILVFICKLYMFLLIEINGGSY